MDTEFIVGVTETNTKVNGEVALDMEMAQTFSATVMSMWVNINLASLMAMGSTSGVMATST